MGKDFRIFLFLLLVLVGCEKKTKSAESAQRVVAPDFELSLLDRNGGSDLVLASDKVELPIDGQFQIRWQGDLDVLLNSRCMDTTTENQFPTQVFSQKIQKTDVLPAAMLIAASAVVLNREYLCELSLHGVLKSGQTWDSHWDNFKIKIDKLSFNVSILDQDGSEPDLIGLESVKKLRVKTTASLSDRSLRLHCDGQEKIFAASDYNSKTFAEILAPFVSLAQSSNQRSIRCQLSRTDDDHILAQSKMLKIILPLPVLQIELLTDPATENVITPDDWGYGQPFLGWKLTNPSETALDFEIWAADSELMPYPSYAFECRRLKSGPIRVHDEEFMRIYNKVIMPVEVPPTAKQIRPDGSLMTSSLLIDYTRDKLSVHLPPKSKVAVGWLREQMRGTKIEETYRIGFLTVADFKLYATHNGKAVGFRYFQPEFPETAVEIPAEIQQQPVSRSIIVKDRNWCE